MNNVPQKFYKKYGKRCKISNCQLNSNNSCLISKNKSKICENYPSLLWGKLPEGCEFEGWIFQQREKIKQQVRKNKESILSLNIELKTASKDNYQKLIENIKKLKTEIEAYAKYGSKDW